MSETQSFPAEPTPPHDPPTAAVPSPADDLDTDTSGLPRGTSDSDDTDPDGNITVPDGPTSI